MTPQQMAEAFYDGLSQSLPGVTLSPTEVVADRSFMQHGIDVWYDYATLDELSRAGKKLGAEIAQEHPGSHVEFAHAPMRNDRYGKVSEYQVNTIPLRLFRDGNFVTNRQIVRLDVFCRAAHG